MSNSQKKSSDETETEKSQEQQKEARKESTETNEKDLKDEQKELDKREKETQKQADDNDEVKQTGLGVAGENPAEPSGTDPDDLPDPDEDGYDPYQDPSVPSSPIADNVRAELASGEGSPTLDACRDAYKAAQKGQ